MFSVKFCFALVSLLAMPEAANIILRLYAIFCQALKCQDGALEIAEN